MIATSPRHQLADMDNDGVAVQVVSPTPVFISYDAPPGDAAKVARIFNELALEITCASPRHVPFCQVPLQDTDAACAELERSLADGHVGVEIGNHIGDQNLDAAGIRTFLQLDQKQRAMIRRGNAERFLGRALAGLQPRLTGPLVASPSVLLDLGTRRIRRRAA